MNDAFAEGNPRRPNTRAGYWECHFYPPPIRRTVCGGVPGTGVRTLSRQVRLEFEVNGNCATIVLPAGLTRIQLTPTRVAVVVGQSRR